LVHRRCPVCRTGINAAGGIEGDVEGIIAANEANAAALVANQERKNQDNLDQILNAAGMDGMNHSEVILDQTAIFVKTKLEVIKSAAKSAMAALLADVRNGDEIVIVPVELMQIIYRLIRAI
jgi:Glu-tRNA(Gln) amidotransferase subunit E-like FAD-binding protein